MNYNHSIMNYLHNIMKYQDNIINYHHKIKLTTLDFSEVPYEMNTLAMMFQSLTYLILISA